MSKRTRADHDASPVAQPAAAEPSSPVVPEPVVEIEVPAATAAAPDVAATIEAAEPAAAEPALPRDHASFVARLESEAKAREMILPESDRAEVAAALLRHETIAPEDVLAAVVRPAEVGIMTVKGQRIAIPRPLVD